MTRVGDGKPEPNVEDFCRPFARASPLAMAAVAGAGNVIRFANSAFCVFAGRRAEQLLGVSLSDVLPAGDEFLSLFDRVYRTGQPETYAVARQDKSTPFFSCALWPILGEDDGALGILIQLSDSESSHERLLATSQALLLGALQQHELVDAVDTLNARLQLKIIQRERNEARLRALLESASEAIIAVDETGTILLVNAMTEKLFGYSRDELLGKPVEILLAVGVRGIHGDQRKTYFAHPRTRALGAGMALSGRRKDGTTFPVEISVGISREGGYETALTLLDDVTDRNRFDEQVRELAIVKSLAVLTGGIAHDFNNLLTGVLGNASMALEQVPAGSSIREILADIIRSGERAAHLTKQMLAYAGQGRYLVQPVNLSDFARDIITLLKRSIPRMAKLDLHLAPEVPMVEADLSQLQQVLVNLITNASEAIGDAPGLVTVRTGVRELPEGYIPIGPGGMDILPGRYVFLEVEDTGVGMDDITRQRIFDPFFTTKFTGRGLGLSAALGIVRGHRGAIEVQSTPGRGSTFTVLLPEKTLRQRPETAAAPGSRGESATILIVDDEAAIGKMAQIMLERAGYKAVVAASGEEAINIFRKDASRIAGVLLDMSMEGMSGAETLKHLRDIRPDIPVALCSGFREFEALSLFRAETGAEFVQKPFTAATLIEKIDGMIAKPPNSGRLPE